MEEYDVVVIGAGLAGLQCARLLGNEGFRVLLADRKNRLDESVHTTGIFVRRTLDDFDIPEDCLGPSISLVTLYSPARRALELTSPHTEFRIGKMGPLYQRYLDHCKRAGVNWISGTRYRGLQLREDHLVVHLENKGALRSIKTRFIVGADGANSRVARDLNLDTNDEWIVGVEEVFTNVPLNGAPQLYCFLEPKLAPGYLAWIAHDGDETHIGVGGYPLHFEPAAALEQFLATIGSIVDLGNARLLERRGGRIPVGGVLRRISNNHGLLVGDAAGAVSPFTAGGLDPCMRLSTLAARVLTNHLKLRDENALNSYSGELFRTRFASRLWMRRLASTLNHQALLEFGCAGLRLPLLNWFAWHIFFGRGSFPDIETWPAPAPVLR